MGHLINPSAMRLGWFSYWEDIWFVNNVYYPEFLHSILKVRCFLVYFFSLSFIETTGFLYSHFVVLKKFKFLIIRIFFFCGVLDEIIDNFFYESRDFFFEKVFYSREFFLPFYFFNFFRLIMIFSLFSSFSLEILKKVGVFTFIKTMHSLNYKKMKLAFFKFKNNNVKIKAEKNRFLFFYFIFISVLNYMNKGNKPNTKKGYNVDFDVILFKVVFKDVLLGKILDCFGFFFNLFICNFFFNYSLSCVIKWDILSNEEINARFLSRYLARKFKQGFSINQILNPVSRELKRVLGLAKYRRDSFSDNVGIGNSDNSMLKASFVKLISFVLKAYRREFFIFYNFNYCWFNFDTLVLYSLIIKRFSYLEKLVGLSCYYFRYKGGFSFFFNVDSFFMQDFFNLNVISIKDLFLDYYNKLKGLNIYYDRINMFLYTFNFVFWSYSLNFLTFLIFDISIFFFNNFIRYNYYRYNYYIYNNLKSKKKIINLKNFCGFRFQFKGRFSRRQRATSTCINVGNVPLTSLNCNIEFGFYTVPIKNSAISVKVWIYKNSEFLSDLDPI